MNKATLDLTTHLKMKIILINVIALFLLNSDLKCHIDTIGNNKINRDWWFKSRLFYVAVVGSLSKILHICSMAVQ